MHPYLSGCSMSSTNTVGKQEAWNGASGSCCFSDPVLHTNTPASTHKQSLSCQPPETSNGSKAAHISCCSSWATAEHPTCPERPQLQLPQGSRQTSTTWPKILGTLWSRREGAETGRKPHRSVLILGIESKVCVFWMCYDLASQCAEKRQKKKAEILLLLIL